MLDSNKDRSYILQVKPQGTDLVCNIKSSSRTSRGCWLELFETFAGSVVIHFEGFYHTQYFFFFFFGYCSWNPQKSEAFRALASLWFLKWVEGKEMLQMILSLNDADIYLNFFLLLSTVFLKSFDPLHLSILWNLHLLTFQRLYLLKHIFNLLLNLKPCPNFDMSHILEIKWSLNWSKNCLILTFTALSLKPLYYKSVYFSNS